MTEEIIIAGFGGQGVFLWERFLLTLELCKTRSCLDAFLRPEMRGGTANVTVIPKRRTYQLSDPYHV